MQETVVSEKRETPILYNQNHARIPADLYETADEMNDAWKRKSSVQRRKNKE